MLLSFTKQIHVYFFHHLNVMADNDFLLSYQHQDFAVLVQAEVAAANRAQEFGAKASAAFLNSASVADPSAPGAFVNGIMENKEWLFVEGRFVEVDIVKTKQAIQRAPRKDVEKVAIRLFENFLSKL